MHAFEACGDPRVRQARGRIVRLNLCDGWIEAAEVVVAGLDNGCHQMDAIGGHLYLADSYNQRIVRVARDGSATELIHPLPTPQGGRWLCPCQFAAWLWRIILPVAAQ